MAIIKPEGMFYGERMKMLSDKSRMLWPHIFVASNTVGRIEINYRKVINRAFVDWHSNPFKDEAEFLSVMGEYQDAFLLFIYEVNGQIWGQWDTPKDSFQRHPLKADTITPEPPLAAMDEWKKTYRNRIQSKPFNLKTFTIPPQVSEIPRETVRGVGVGGGVGKAWRGKTKPPQPKAENSDKRFQPSREFIERCCKHANVAFVWDGAEAMQLSKWLKAVPDISQDRVEGMIRNRFRSKDPPGDRPCTWIPKLSRWDNTVTNEFNKPEGNHGKTTQRIEHNDRAGDEAEALLGIAQANSPLLPAGDGPDPTGDGRKTLELIPARGSPEGH